MCGEVVKAAETIEAEEVRRARAQLTAGILMAREGPSARCEQLAQQLLVYGRPLSLDEIMSRVDAVDVPEVSAVARRLRAGPLTVTALGPVDRLESYDGIAARLM
jgi:predicted Zn-dependent peptidase